MKTEHIISENGEKVAIHALNPALNPYALNPYEREFVLKVVQLNGLLLL
jgi:hypothetical protein